MKHLKPCCSRALLTLLLFVLGLAISAPPARSQSKNIAPAGRKVMLKRLPNGLTYYIDTTETPEKKVQLYLIVGAGSFNEDTDQQEYAHLVEHLAFEGTESYPLDSLRGYLDMKGLKLGLDYNAYTSGSNTGYEISLPQDNPALLDDCLTVFQQWLGHIQLDKSRIKGQSGAVHSEITRGNNRPEDLLFMAETETLLGWPIFGPAAKEKRLKSMRQVNPDRLRDFYKDWYRPELAAIIVSGKADPDAVEKRIISLFAPMTNPANARQFDYAKKQTSGTMSGRNQLILQADPHLSKISVDIFFKQADSKKVDNSPARYYRESLNKICAALLSERFRKTRSYSTPEAYVSATPNRLESRIDLFTVSFSVSDTAELKNGIQYVYKEINRCLQNGFTAEEIAGVKTRYIEEHKGYLRYATSASSRAGRYRDHFVDGKAVREPEEEFSMMAEATEKITAAAIQAHLKSLLAANGNRDISIKAAVSTPKQLPGEQTIESWIDAVAKNPLPSYQSVDMKKAMSAALKDICKPNGTEYTEKDWKCSQIKSIRLANGLNVMIALDTAKAKPGTPKKIQLMAVSNTGSEKYEGLTRIVAESMSGLVQFSGVGPFDKFQLTEVSDPHQTHGSPYIGAQTTRVNLKGPEKEMEYMLQLACLYFRKPRFEDAAFREWKKNLKASERFNSIAVRQEIDSLTWIDNRSSFTSTAQVDSVALSDYAEIYKEVFSSAGNFTFYLFGVRDYEKARDLVAKYLGCLPTQRPGSETSTFSTPTSYKKVFHVGGDSKAQVRIMLPSKTSIQHTLKEKLIREAVSLLIHDLIFERLRTKEGGTYTPVVFLKYKRLSASTAAYSINTAFDCDISNTDNMVKYALEEFSNLKRTGISEVTFRKKIVELKAQYETEYYKNIQSDNLIEWYRYNDDPNEYFNINSIIDTITQEDIQKVIDHELSADNIQQIIILPENQASK